MQAALATIWICVALGTGLGLSQRFGAKLTNPIRSFAVVSAGLVAIVVLLPHAIEAQGWWGLLAATIALAAIPSFERVGGALFRGLPTQTVRLEVGYVGLIVHRFGDGVAMRVEGHGADVLFALGAHEIPIVALVTLAYLPRGLATALLRAALLGAASTVGCAVVDVLPVTLQDLHGYADAVAAGVLLHIVAHELSEPAPSRGERGLDVLGAALGGFIVWLPTSAEDGHGELGLTLLRWLLACAPAFGAGLGLSALLRAAGALPGAAARRDNGSSLLALPEGQPENISLSIGLIGWRLTALRLAAGSVLAAIIAVARWRASPPTITIGKPPERIYIGPRGSLAERLWAGLQEALLASLVWLMLGVVAAAYVDAFLPEALLGARHFGVELGAALAVAVLARCSPAAATPLAAALLAKGLAPSGALLGFWLGLLSNRAALGALEQAFGKKPGWFVAGALGAIGLSLALAFDVRLAPPAAAKGAEAAPPYAWPSLVVIALVSAAGMVKTGVRGWVASGLGTPFAGSAAQHSHDGIESHAVHGAGSSRARDAS